MYTLPFNSMYVMTIIHNILIVLIKYKQYIEIVLDISMTM